MTLILRQPWAVCLALLMTVHISTVTTELYTAVSEMEELLETEALLIDNLENYISVTSKKLEYLKIKAREYQREHVEASHNVADFLTNPINAFLLTKRLTTDWKQVEAIMTHDVGQDFVRNISEYRGVLKFPSDEDLNGAAVALIRLQDTYNLDTSSISSGILNGVQYSTGLTAGDCFELGRQTYVNGDHFHTVLWMREAMDLIRTETNTTTTKETILEYLAFSTYKQGNTASALELTNTLLEINPNHQLANGNKLFYEKELRVKREDQNLKGDDGTQNVPKDEANFARKRAVSEGLDLPERTLYEMMCRGDIERPPKALANLKCRYVTNRSPFLKIGPLKLEEMNHQPYIVVYHDVLFDDEIELFQSMAKPRFRRATVQNHKTGALEVAAYRISKSAWLKDDEDEAVRRVSLRVEDMTGLTVDTAEELQVVNYGLGGHYEPHYDFARREEKNAFKSLGTGNRIATVLFYMSDVPQGGATVFPSLKIALWPKKGTAAFWYNLHKSGEGDYLTRHAACPVLVGSKWVCNKWLHVAGQEQLRPCGLEPDHPEEF